MPQMRGKSLREGCAPLCPAQASAQAPLRRGSGIWGGGGSPQLGHRPTSPCRVFHKPNARPSSSNEIRPALLGWAGTGHATPRGLRTVISHSCTLPPVLQIGRSHPYPQLPPWQAAVRGNPIKLHDLLLSLGIAVAQPPLQETAVRAANQSC